MGTIESKEENYKSDNLYTKLLTLYNFDMSAYSKHERNQNSKKEKIFFGNFIHFKSPNYIQSLKNRCLLMNQFVRIRKRSRWETGAWELLLSECRYVLSKHKGLYGICVKNVLKFFPTSIVHLKELLNISSDCIESYKQIFRLLLSKPVLSISLWREFLSFTQNTYNEKENVFRLEKAYKYTLTRLGEDIDSGGIWIDYLHFLISIFRSRI